MKVKPVNTIIYAAAFCLAGCSTQGNGGPSAQVDVWEVGLQRLVSSMDDLTAPDQYVGPIPKDTWDKAKQQWAELRPVRRGETIDCDDFVAAYRGLLVLIWADVGIAGLPAWEGEVRIDGERHRLLLVVLAAKNGWRLRALDPETMLMTSPKRWDWIWIKG